MLIMAWAASNADSLVAEVGAPPSRLCSCPPWLWLPFPWSWPPWLCPWCPPSTARVSRFTTIPAADGTHSCLVVLLLVLFMMQTQHRQGGHLHDISCSRQATMRKPGSRLLPAGYQLPRMVQACVHETQPEKHPTCARTPGTLLQLPCNLMLFTTCQGQRCPDSTAELPSLQTWATPINTRRAACPPETGRIIEVTLCMHHPEDCFGQPPCSCHAGQALPDRCPVSSGPPGACVHRELNKAPLTPLFSSHAAPRRVFPCHLRLPG